MRSDWSGRYLHIPRDEQQREGTLRIDYCPINADLDFEEAIGTVSKRLSWFAECFQECWFELDTFTCTDHEGVRLLFFADLY